MKRNETTNRTALAVGALCLLLAAASPAEERARPTAKQGKMSPSTAWTNICQLGTPAWLDPNVALEPQSTWGGLLQKATAAYAMDSASAMLEVYEKSPGGQFGTSFEANRDFLLSLSKKNSETDQMTFEEHKALLTVRMALYIDAALGLAAAYPGSKNKRFRDTYDVHHLRLAAVAKEDWRTYKDWRTLKMDFSDTDAVCEVLAAYLGKDRPSR